MEEVIDFTNERFNPAREKINRMFVHGKTWKDIEFAGQKDEQELEKYLISEDFDVSAKEWHALVKLQKENVERSEAIDVPPVFLPEAKNGLFKIPKMTNSLWVDYKRRLEQEKHFLPKDIQAIETSTLKTLNHLKRDTDPHKPIKGVVVGNVQSGKTANMAALIAMASDYGWNMFIIMTGTIESLRKQTLDRLENDLHSNSALPTITAIDDIKKKSLSSLHLGMGDKDRYLLACLKNSTRIRNLLVWLNKDISKKKQIRLLIIDDEADQASINTKDVNSDERTAINRLLIDLAYDYQDIKKRRAEPDAYFACSNYVGYTATPYGNFLNEGPSVGDTLTLFPEDFIGVLQNSKTYFGPQQIFGAPGLDRLKVVNHIDSNESKRLQSIISGDNLDLPQGLKESFLWFCCCLACFRHWGKKQPVSMLANLSQRVDSHDNGFKAFEKYIHSLSENSFLSGCKKIYEEQISLFTKADFLSTYPDYAGASVRDYPSFSDIAEELKVIFAGGFGLVEKDPDTKRRIYTKGIHCFIDNGRYSNSDRFDSDYRVEYPTKEDDLGFATGFLVIGGQTLSRGLTIEGLVSTYFPRNSKQADTLMQMGRWFGYRKGYELLPRIWMTQDNDDRFAYISRIDFELKRDIEEFSADDSKSPRDYGIYVLNTPFPSWMRVTARNKMQEAVIDNADFSNYHPQTTKFYPDKETLTGNLNALSRFIVESLSAYSHRKVERRHIWNGVPWEKVFSILGELKYPSTDCDEIDLPAFREWVERSYEKGLLDPWEIVISGPDDVEESKIIQLGGLDIAMVNRAREGTDVREDGLISIGALRDNRDLYIGIPEEIRKGMGFTPTGRQAKINQLREDAGFGKVPQLIFYVVDKDSKPKRRGYVQDLNASQHVLGFALNVPRGNPSINSSEHLVVDMRKYRKAVQESEGE